MRNLLCFIHSYLNNRLKSNIIYMTNIYDKKGWGIRMRRRVALFSNGWSDEYLEAVGSGVVAFAKTADIRKTIV